MARKTILALTTGDRGGAQTSASVAWGNAFDVSTNFHDCARKFVAQDDWRIVWKCVAQNVNICPTHPAKADLELDLVFTATGFRHVADLDVSIPRGELNEGFHGVANRVQQFQEMEE